MTVALVETMDNSEDVERLFSWLKAPKVHYREFAPQRETAEAVATWPVLHRAAVEAGIALADEPAPQGDAAAKERILRDRMTLPTRPMESVAAAQTPIEALPETPAETLLQMPPASRPEERLRVMLGDQAEAGRYEPAESVITAGQAGSVAATPREAAVEPTIAGFEQPAAPPSRPATSRAEPYENRPAEPTRHYPAPERAALFGGEYGGRERGAQPGTRVADRQDRSLDAVFSRLSGGRDRLPDPRARARTNPGLGPVFSRLR